MSKYNHNPVNNPRKALGFTLMNRQGRSNNQDSQEPEGHVSCLLHSQQDFKIFLGVLYLKLLVHLHKVNPNLISKHRFISRSLLEMLELNLLLNLINPHR
jgi:hypothetical protein